MRSPGFACVDPPYANRLILVGLETTTKPGFAIPSLNRSSVKKICAEYIWIDGQKPTAILRSKTKIIDGPVKSLSELPDWGFDGSSTSQAEGHFSDCQLKPVKIVPDPLHGDNDILVLCEVFNADGTVH